MQSKPEILQRGKTAAKLKNWQEIKSNMLYILTHVSIIAEETHKTAMELNFANSSSKNSLFFGTVSTEGWHHDRKAEVGQMCQDKGSVSDIQKCYFCILEDRILK